MSGMTRRAGLGAAVSVAVGALAGCNGPQKPTSTSFQIKVGSRAMEPTLVKGKMVTVDAILDGSYRPRREDVVLFHPPTAWDGFAASSLLVSRVIGIPGDHVSCTGRGASLILNGAELKEPYVYPGDTASWIKFDVTVPSGRLWLLDDYRSDGIDCRSQLSDPDNGAFVPTGNIVGICKV